MEWLCISQIIPNQLISVWKITVPLEILLASLLTLLLSFEKKMHYSFLCEALVNMRKLRMSSALWCTVIVMSTEVHGDQHRLANLRNCVEKGT